MDIIKMPAEGSRKTIRIVFCILLIVCAVIGTILNAVKFGAASTISYFTIQSNLLCIAAAGVTLMREIKKRDLRESSYIFFKGMSLVSILLTFFVYNFVLRPFLDSVDSNRVESPESILLHTVVPLMMFADFLFFEEKGCFKKWYPFGWAVFPVFYIGYTAVYRAFGGVYVYTDRVANFPYFFLDYESYGINMVGLWVLFITIGFIGFSFLLLGFSGILLKLKSKLNRRR